MKSIHSEKSLETGTPVEAGTYRCVSCGHVMKLKAAGELPSCPQEEGHHAIKAWKRFSDHDRTARPHNPR
ncbi:MAG: hypothetical protein KDA93_25490 [Planctomycetaceae bacterium]|nr:hypothetical protein [Planctomycetaceae bacterium]